MERRISQFEVGWAIGFWEGEGSVHHDPERGMLRVSANQAVLQPLLRLRRILGGRIRVAVRSYKGEEHTMYEWQAVGVRAAGICMTFYAKLSPRRQEQVRLALERWRSHRAHHRHWTVCKYDHPFTPENTYVHPVTGSRRCRTCVNKRNARYEREKREARGGQPRAKLTASDVRAIRRLAVTGTSQGELCRLYGIKAPAMSVLLAGKTWKHVV